MSKVWGYIGTTQIIELNPERKKEALLRGYKILIEENLKKLNPKIEGEGC